MAIDRQAAIVRLNKATEKACSQHGDYRFVSRDAWIMTIRRISDRKEFTFAGPTDLKSVYESSEQDLIEVMTRYLKRFDER